MNDWGWVVTEASRDQEWNGVYEKDEVTLSIKPMTKALWPKPTWIDPTLVEALRAYFSPGPSIVPVVWRMVDFDFRWSVESPLSARSEELEVRFVRMAPSAVTGEDVPQGWSTTGVWNEISEGLMLWLDS